MYSCTGSRCSPRFASERSRLWPRLLCASPASTWSRTADQARCSHYVLALPLLVLGVFANHVQDAPPAYYLALAANRLNTRSYLQSSPPSFAVLPGLPRTVSGALPPCVARVRLLS